MIIRCQSCFARLTVPAGFDRAQAHCPKCKALVAIPATDLPDALAVPSSSLVPKVITQPVHNESEDRKKDRAWGGIQSRKPMHAIFAGAALLTVIFFVMGVVRVLGSRGSPSESTASGSPTNHIPAITQSPKNAGQIRDLDREIRSRRDDLDRLRQKHKELEAEKEKLERQKKEIQKQIEDLVLRFQELRAWREVDFVLTDSSRAIGLAAEHDGGFKTIAKARDSELQLAMLVARKARIPVVRSKQALTKEIFSNSYEGRDLAPGDASRICPFWQPLEKNENTQYVVFRDLNTKRNRVGLIDPRQVSDDRLEFTSFGTESESIARSQIQPGTARRGKGKDFASTLRDSDFLDYCLLDAVHSLDAERHVALAVDVQTDSPKNVDWSYVRVALGGLELTLAGSAASDNLEMVSKYVEDEIYAKLVKLRTDRFEVLEREEMERVLKEVLNVRTSLIADGIDFIVRRGPKFKTTVKEFLRDLSLQSWTGATHILIVEIKPPLKGGAYHLSVRLVKVGTGEVLWAEQGDRTLDCPSDQYFLQSGRLAQVSLKGSKHDGLTVETPPVLPLGRLNTTATATDGLVLLENGRNPDECTFRPLFSRALLRLPKSEVRIIKNIDTSEQVLAPDQVRYLLWRLSKMVLPPAGRITSALGVAEYQVSIGKNSGLHPGDQLRVARLLPNHSGTLPLATVLTVSRQSEDECVASPQTTGFEAVWGHEAYVNLDDIVYASSKYVPVIAIEPFEFKGPANQEISVVAKWHLPVRRERLTTQAEDACLVLQQALNNGLQNLHICVAQTTPTQVQRRNRNPYAETPPPSKNVTHVIRASVTLLEPDKYQFDVVVQRPNSSEIIDRFGLSMMVSPRGSK